MNTVNDLERLLQNTIRILVLSRNCSALIDVLNCGHYNIDMDENDIITLVAIETVAPKRRITRSAGAIYIILILLIFGCISAGNLFYERFLIPRYVTQPILYAMIASFGYLVYRRNYLRYRYTLTTKTLAIEQIGGNEEKTLAAIDLVYLLDIQQNPQKRKNNVKTVFAYLPPVERITWVLANEDGEETRYAISASEEFLVKLNEQWQQAKLENDNRAQLSPANANNVD